MSNNEDINQTFDSLAGVDSNQTPVPVINGRLKLRHKFLRWLIKDYPVSLPSAPKEDEEFFLMTARELLSSNLHDEFILGATKNLLGQHRLIEDTKARRRLEGWARKVIIWYLVLVGCLVLLNGASQLIWPAVFPDHGFISDMVMTVILSTTTVNIIGLGVIVLRGHFHKGSEPESRKSPDNNENAVQ